jgi:C4-dicarboxylate-specific signal transduction histidine kinase
LKPIFPFGTERDDNARSLPGNDPPTARRQEIRRASARFARLSAPAQETVKLLALIGNASSPTTLALGRNRSVEALCPELQEAVDAGLIIMRCGRYWFTSSAAEEGVYNTIPERERESVIQDTMLASMATAECANWLENIRLYRDDAHSEFRDRDAHADIIHANRLRMVGQLTASVAHEISQPIAASIVNAQAALRWLSAEPANLDEVRQALERVLTNGSRAGEVLSRTRAIIRKDVPHTGSVDINDAVREMAEFTGAELARNGIRVATSFANGSPSVLGDRVELQQVVLNMIINAIHAMCETKKAGRRLLFKTSAIDSGEVLVAVSDTGRGLRGRELELAFRPFHTTKPGGLGIGLAVCRSIIEAHGGRMWAESNNPRGTTFLFSVKAAPPAKNGECAGR